MEELWRMPAAQFSTPDDLADQADLPAAPAGVPGEEEAGHRRRL